MFSHDDFAVFVKVKGVTIFTVAGHVVIQQSVRQEQVWMDTSESGLEVDFERGADFDSEFVSLQGGAQLFYTPPCQHCQCHNLDSRGPTTLNPFALAQAHVMFGLMRSDTQPFTSYKFESLGRRAGKATTSTNSLSSVVLLKNEFLLTAGSCPSNFNTLI